MVDIFNFCGKILYSILNLDKLFCYDSSKEEN